MKCFQTACLLILCFFFNIPDAFAGDILQRKFAQARYKDNSKTFEFIVHCPGDCQCTHELSYNGTAFYDTGIKIVSYEYPLEKHLKSQVHKRIIFDFLIIALHIAQIDLTDAGDYRCNFDCIGSLKSQLYTFLVLHAPSKAICEWDEQHDTSIAPLSILRCSAKAGVPCGTIACYSADEEKIFAHPPQTESCARYLTASFWLDTNAEIVCCSTNSEYIKDYHNCRDFIHTHSPMVLVSSVEPSRTADTTTIHGFEKSTSNGMRTSLSFLHGIVQLIIGSAQIIFLQRFWRWL